MPWSGSAPNMQFTRGSGVYSGATTWQQTDAAARGIRADDHDVHDEDIADGLDLAARKDGGNIGTAWSPATNVASSLGTTTLGWNGLHLGTGTAINWANSALKMTHSAGALTVEYTDAGAAGGPIFALDRVSATPAVNDVIGNYYFNGRSSTGVSRIYAAISGAIIDPTNTSEDGTVAFSTMVAGTSANRVLVGAGMFSLSATSGDKGVDSANFSAYYDDGTRIGGAVVASFAADKGGVNQTGVATATYVKVTFTETFDVGAAYASSTWTPPAGTALITASVYFATSGGTLSLLQLALYKNGVIYKERYHKSTIADVVTATWIVQTNGTDTWEIYVRHNLGSDMTIDGTAALTWVSGSMI